jgi:subfamily B ATP-binding cassette protein MsbA
MKKLKIIKTLLPLLKLYPWVIPAVIILGIISSLAEGLGISLLIPFLQTFETANQYTINSPFVRFINHIFTFISLNQRPLIITICILVAIILKIGVSYIYTILCYWLKCHVLHYLRCSIFKQFMSVGIIFWDNYKCGELMDTLIQQTDNSCRALTHLIWLIIDLCIFFIFSILLILISWKLTLLVAVALVFISSIIPRITSQAERLGQEHLKASKHLHDLMVEGLTGIKTIQAFGRELYEQKQFEHVSRQARNLLVKLRLLSAMVEPFYEGLTVAVLVCVMFIALKNQITLPILITFIFMLYRLQPRVKNFDHNRIEIIALTSSVKEVMSLLDSSNKPYVRSGKIPFPGLEHGIFFNSVTFYYNVQNKPALENISISIPKGKTTALVGYSGAGKSTLINLIFRFYDVTEGEIYVDDYPLQELDLTSWRSRIAMVSQDVHIFNTTVWENIVYGRLDATKEKIVVAAKQANAHEFICNLPQGYDTHVGDRGVRLSGGQRQRISIARAILCNPEILILDEATNALDSVSEHLIQKAINTLSQNCTVIIIAHRLSTIEQADQIVVLEEGRVVEQGNFQNLIKLNGSFAKIYHLQYGSVQI